MSELAIYEYSNNIQAKKNVCFALHELKKRGADFYIYVFCSCSKLINSVQIGEKCDENHFYS